MAKFGINDIMNVKSMASGTEKVSEYKEIWLSPYEVKPSENNFYSQEKIEELADSFLAVGQQQPSVLARIDGGFIIVSGHRRNLANIYNIERGYEEYKKVRYLYKDMTPAMLDLSLLMGNACNRELTAWEKTQQAQRFKEALIKARDEDGLEIRGKLRNVIADIMNESSSGIARMDSINHNAVPEIKEEFRKGNLSICAAYEAAKLPEEEQKEIAERASAEAGIKAKEIAEKQKVRSYPVVSRLDAVPQSQSECAKMQKDGCEKNVREGGNRQKKTDGKNKTSDRTKRHMKILQEWETAGMNRTSVTKVIEDAVQMMSRLDTGKVGWTDADWVIFIAGNIINRAACVSEEDLYLLHDIMIRCREETGK